MELPTADVPLAVRRLEKETMANKKSDIAPSFAPAVKALLLCAFFMTSGVGYVWYKNANEVLGKQIIDLEHRVADLRLSNKSRQDQWAALCSPGELDTRVKKMNLGLGIPAVSQVVHLPEPSSMPASPSANMRPASAGRDGVEIAN